MGKSEYHETTVNGVKLVCPICKNDKFWDRATLMNTAGMTFLGIEYFNEEAVNHICSKCGYIFWFFPIYPETSRQESDGSKQKEVKEEGWWYKK